MLIHPKPGESEESFHARQEAEQQRLERLVRATVQIAVQELTADLSKRVDSMGIELGTNTAATQRIDANVGDIIDVFNAVKGGFKVLGWLGWFGDKLLKFGVPAFAAAYTFMWWLKGGGPPPKP